MNQTILAIESSCDETSAAVVQGGKVISNIVATQSVHEQYGGVVPELASRAHQKHIVPVIDQALKQAGIKKQDLDAIAFTKGPGLLGALLVGSSFAKSMAQSLGIPLIGINHMQAHILAHFIDEPHPKFPFLCLTVSGGHTQLVVVHDHLTMEVVGETQDDAVGEAFDKTAKIIGLPYPGGPLIDKYAQEGNPLAYEFPDVSTTGLNFSFSGIKTAFLNFLRKEVQKDPDFIKNNLPDICASIQHTLIRILLKKLKKATKQYKISEIAIAGGVSANSGLRKTLQEMGKEKGWNVYIPKFEYCTDNAAMIAITAHYKYLKGEFEDLTVTSNPRLKFEGINQ
ncbi:tRNA (adenosine(37)-N6)-threonylcarbamoyltransferase complex transferase subunit TsaD [Limibacter armeniacum]|uniref:tRNA (adenosine(37)-N6)-threonylcarbamoyltransferase complex transferase subunit TsaD n=1 Tax=Limibacter armeniacum TaxID=466084 RepID=UPI002FE615FE